MENQRLVDSVEREPDREIRLNKPEANDERDFCGNDVSTTKYSLLSFFPKNLWEQFQRVANLYFLLISLVQIFSNASPTGKYNTFSTLVVVLFISGGKEAYEDWKRHQADLAHNQRQILVQRRLDWYECEWSDVLVGDIIKVVEGDEIPADTVILSTSLPDGKCYIETSNLDGEANLKIRNANAHTVDLKDDSAQLGAVSGKVQCSAPSMSMLAFDGRWLLDGDVVLALSLENLAMRGCRLRNTKWITGVVVYTGHETKIMLNSTPTRFKQSSLEKVANTLIIVVFLFEMLLCIFAALSAGIWHSSYVGTGEHTAWYLANEQSPSGFAAEAFLSFFILVSNLIPISLYVTMELMKICLSWMIEQDLDMYSAVGDEAACARTTNLSEELGQVGYVFSDKTGTLTSNDMMFRKCSIAGEVFIDDNVPYGTGLTEAAAEGTVKQPFACALLSEALARDPEGNEALFLRILALCHTVLPESKPDSPDELIYQGSSPDDVALVEAAAAVGVVFVHRDNHSITIQVADTTEQYQVLSVLDFSSDRKRMSVVVQHSDGSVHLYCKGADTVIFPRLASGQDDFVDDLCGQLQQFASDGLRTLCVAHKQIEAAEWSEWLQRYEQARASMDGRAALVESCMDELELSLQLIGVTAIEDKLQFGVPAALRSLAAAGIKTWMLTGDKSETAINIGFSCRLLSERMLPLIELTSGDAAELSRELDKALAAMAAHDIDSSTQPAGRQWGLVMEGRAMAVLFDPVHEELQTKMVQVALRADAVLGCRCSPMQKAEVVEIIQQSVDCVSLAIGDGANDVSMLQAAHVGVGIAGLEGRSAVNSSDYSIAQFRFLVPLLLWHGHNSYRRISKLMLYFFYKNIVFNLPLYFYAISAGWSGQSMYEAWSIMGFNVAFTALPVMALALVDQDLPKHAVLSRPELYKSGPQRYYFNVWVLICWVITGIWHSLVILWMVMNVYSRPTSILGKDLDIFDMGVVTYTLVLLVVTGKLILEMHWYTWVSYFSIISSLALWFAWCFASNLWFDLMPDVYMSIYHLCGTASFYFILAAGTVTALARDFAWKYSKRVYFPTPYHLVQRAIANKESIDDLDLEISTGNGALRRILIVQLARCMSALRGCVSKSDSAPMYTGNDNRRQPKRHTNHSDL